MKFKFSLKKCLFVSSDTTHQSGSIPPIHLAQVMKGCLPDQIAQFVREQFGQYDTKGDGLKTRQVFELLGALSCRPETVED